LNVLFKQKVQSWGTAALRQNLTFCQMYISNTAL